LISDLRFVIESNTKNNQQNQTPKSTTKANPKAGSEEKVRAIFATRPA
jgi:hypothetical protein